MDWSILQHLLLYSVNSDKMSWVLNLFSREMGGNKFVPFIKIYLGTFDRSIVANVMCRFQGNRILFDRPFGVFTLTDVFSEICVFSFYFVLFSSKNFLQNLRFYVFLHYF